MTRPREHDRRTGLDRLRAANRWMVVGALGLTGAFSWIAAKAFPGKAATATRTTTSSTDSSSASSSADQTQEQPLTPPQEAPALPQPQYGYQAPAVSGGS